MKKGFSKFILTLVLFCFGGFLCACNDATAKPTSITILDMPTTVNYTVGQSLQLSGGSLKVEYDDGTTKNFPMTLATPNITTFSAANTEQQIILSFLDFTTRFSVRVDKGDLTPQINSRITENTKPVVTVSYTGEQITFSGLNKNSIPTEVLNGIHYYYKNPNVVNAEYSETDLPVNAGRYLVKVKIDASQNYNGCELECYLDVQKCNLFDLVLDGESLNYDDAEINKNGVKYGQTVVLSNYWRYKDNTLGEAPLPQGVKSELQYLYKQKGTQDYISILPDMVDGSFKVSLPVGQYDIKIALQGDSNIANYEYIFTMVVVKTQLVRGVDYDLYISDGTTTTLLDANTVVPTVSYDASKTYSLTLVSHIGAGIFLKEGTTYYIGNSTSGSTILSGSGLGNVRAVFNVNGDTNHLDVSNETVVFEFV